MLQHSCYGVRCNAAAHCGDWADEVEIVLDARCFIGHLLPYKRAIDHCTKVLVKVGWRASWHCCTLRPFQPHRLVANVNTHEDIGDKYMM